MTLNLTQNVLNTYVGWHAQVLHDLHESVPFLYDNTIGDGPYNAWLDPILTNEWADDRLEQRPGNDERSACPACSRTATSTPGAPAT